MVVEELGEGLVDEGVVEEVTGSELLVLVKLVEPVAIERSEPGSVVP